MQETNKSVLTLEAQSKLTLSGVTAVDYFGENEIVLTVGGKKLKISGSRLKVLSFSEGSGNFAASGEFVTLKFTSKPNFGKFLRS